MLKKILLVLGVLVLLVVLAVVGGVFWFSGRLNSAETREQVRAAASEKLGTEVKLANHRISLLGSARFEGLAVANAAPYQDAPLLSLQTFEADVSLLSVLRGHPTIKRIEVKDVRIQAYQNTDGSLSLPFKPSPKKDPAEGGEPAMTDEELAQLNATIESIKLGNVNVQVFDPEKNLLAGITDLNVDGSVEVAGGVPSSKMALTMATLQVTPGLKVMGIQSPLEYAGGQVVLSQITGKLAGGAVTGKTKAQVLDPARLFEADFQVKDAAMADLMRDMGSDPTTLTGPLQGTFAGKGTLNAPKDLTGQGTFEIDKPVVGKLKNPVMPTGFIGMPALQSGQFDTIKGTYRIEGQKILVDDLQILSKGLNIVITGDVGFDKVLNLSGRMRVDSNPVGAVADVAQGFMKGLFGSKKKEEAAPAPTTAETSPSASESLKGGIPFTVTGPTDKPVVRPVGADPLNILAMLGKALGFEVGAAPAAGESASPVESVVPAPEATPAPTTPEAAPAME